MREKLLKLKIDGYVQSKELYEDKNFVILIPYYKAEASISRSDAQRSLKDARGFVERITNLIEELAEQSGGTY